jgi:DNA (cytosine-5)-methyltransferase 1
MKSHMRYASVCDGIGAVHAAWQPLGWECAWTSEIEPFPAAVVDHHWKLKNLGDMTKLTEEMLNECGPVSLLCGGTPCQSFSVAGLRKGLEDPRGNLALRFTQLVGVIRPQWVVWENVPGVLSSGNGRDFGTFLGALAELGYGFAYRVLDAQWFGVAQRRRRVFVVAHAGDWRRAAAVLFERESLFGNPPTRGTERQTTSDGIGESSPTVSSKWAKGTGGFSDAEHYNLVAFQGGSQQDQVLSGEAVCPSLCHSSNGHKGHHQPKVVVPFTKAKRAQSDTDDESWVLGEVAPTQNQFDVGDTRATTVVAFNTWGGEPRADRPNGGFYVEENAEVSKTLDSHGGLNPSASQGGTVVAFTQNCRDEVRQINGDGQIVGALSAEAGSHQTNYVAFDVHGTLATKGASTTDCHTALRARPPGQSEASTTTVVCGDGDTIGTIRSNTRNNSSPKTEAAMHIMHGMAVRRLTPRECERLQGFPDGYTDVTYRNKPAADGPRYRALGNSMAVPVMAWIGKRIAEVEATDGTHAK